MNRWLAATILTVATALQCAPEVIVIATGDSLFDAAPTDNTTLADDSPDNLPDESVNNSPNNSPDSSTDTPLTADDGHSGTPTPQRCRTAADCNPYSLCDKAACGDSEGVCHRQTDVCSADPKPVCGCDGVTYFNDCWRRAAGQEAATQGECDVNAKTCFGPGTCPPPSLCAMLFPSSSPACAPGTSATCWVLPAVCNADSQDVDRWTACPLQGAPSNPITCVDTCTAIHSGIPHLRALNCPSQ